MNNPAVVWTKHLRTEEARKNFENMLRGNVVVNERLIQILHEKRGSNQAKLADYESPSWAYLQADKNGYDRAIKDILELFNFQTKEKR